VEGRINERFDIFCFEPDGLRWLTAVDTLEAAKAYIAELPEPAQGEYGVLDQRSGARMFFHYQHGLGKTAASPPKGLR
jgi:hypothetical protein